LLINSKYKVINYALINELLPCHATGRGSTMAAPGPGHGQVALDAKPGALPWGP